MEPILQIALALDPTDDSVVALWELRHSELVHICIAKDIILLDSNELADKLNNCSYAVFDNDDDEPWEVTLNRIDPEGTWLVEIDKSLVSTVNNGKGVIVKEIRVLNG